MILRRQVQIEVEHFLRVLRLNHANLDRFVIVGGMWFGAPGILFGQALGGVIFAGVTLILVRHVLSKEASGQVQHEPFARQARLFQILHHRR